jgi:CheY-like chemotaxis protein
MVRLLETILHEAGYCTVTHHQGAGAVTFLHAVRPTLLILNIRMEQLHTGWQVLDNLRRDPAFVQLPVLIHSAYPQVEAQVAARADPYCTALPLFSELDTLPALVAQLLPA